MASIARSVRSQTGENRANTIEGSNPRPSGAIGAKLLATRAGTGPATMDEICIGV